MLKRTLAVATALVSMAPALSFGSGGGGYGFKDPSEEFHHLWNEMLMDITIIGILFSIVTVYFLVRYRRTRPDQEGDPPKLSTAAVLGWALIPAFIFMADDFFLAARGWSLWNNYRTVPEDRYEVRLESAMWSWNFIHPGGVEQTNELRVPAGKPVLVRMTSRDTIHSMFLPEFRVKEDSMPGRITYLWFYPESPGEYKIMCAEYCGVLHSNMLGKVIAMPGREFESWLKEEQAKVNEGGA